MAPTMTEQCVVIEPCSWDTYERILTEHGDRPFPRFTYSKEALEVLSPSPEHEEASEILKEIVYAVCEELAIEVRGLGSTTQRRFHLQKGVEPDGSFYFGDLPRDSARDIPDLVVEIEVSRSAVDKMEIFAALGAPEVWRCDTNIVRIFQLQGNDYCEVPCSQFLTLSSEAIALFLKLRPQMKRAQWLRSLRQRVREEMDLV
jgi:Uma2 family endonuclease